MESNPQVPAPTLHKILGPGIDGRGILSVPEQLAWDWPSMRPPERVPEVAVVSRKHLPHLDKIQEVLPSRRDEAHFR